MLGVKVPLTDAEQVKQYLRQHDLADTSYRSRRSEDAITFPIVRKFNSPWEFDVDFVEEEFEQHDHPEPLRESLRSHLSDGEMDNLITAFDIVGDIAIIEIPESLKRKELLIAEKLMYANKHVKTVLKKIGGHEGELRTQRMEWIAGEDTRETEVAENGIRLRVNVEEAYYSIRMATERKRVWMHVQPGEKVLCLFSGVGPYPITISRHTEASEIIGIELNSIAHQLAVENVALNRCTNVHLVQGDAHKVMRSLAADKQSFDRITMPLPHTAAEFLDDAVRVCKSGGTIHYYSFQAAGEFEKAVDAVRTACRRNGRQLDEFSLVKAGQHAPRVWRICVDAKVT